MERSVLELECGHDRGPVSAKLVRACDARALYVFAHGAGAGMDHPFMRMAALKLANHGVSTLRFQFPYMEAGRGVPDPRPVLFETIRSAVSRSVELADGLPVLAGGKSMGGRMTSLLASQGGIEGVDGLVFFGFPLHPAGRPSVARAAHLKEVPHPMLFLQGTRDRLADLDLLTGALRELRPSPALHLLEGADHGFDVLRRSGRSLDDVIEEACGTVALWLDELD